MMMMDLEPWMREATLIEESCEDAFRGGTLRSVYLVKVFSRLPLGPEHMNSALIHLRKKVPALRLIFEKDSAGTVRLKSTTKPIIDCQFLQKQLPFPTVEALKTYKYKTDGPLWCVRLVYSGEIGSNMGDATTSPSDSPEDSDTELGPSLPPHDTRASSLGESSGFDVDSRQSSEESRPSSPRSWPYSSTASCFQPKADYYVDTDDSRGDGFEELFPSTDSRQSSEDSQRSSPQSGPYSSTASSFQPKEEEYVDTDDSRGDGFHPGEVIVAEGDSAATAEADATVAPSNWTPLPALEIPDNAFMDTFGADADGNSLPPTLQVMEAETPNTDSLDSEALEGTTVSSSGTSRATTQTAHLAAQLQAAVIRGFNNPRIPTPIQPHNPNGMANAGSRPTGPGFQVYPPPRITTLQPPRPMRMTNGTARQLSELSFATAAITATRQYRRNPAGTDSGRYGANMTRFEKMPPLSAAPGSDSCSNSASSIVSTWSNRSSIMGLDLAGDGCCWIILGIHPGIADSATALKILNLLLRILDRMILQEEVDDDEQLGSLLLEGELFDLLEEHKMEINANPALKEQLVEDFDYKRWRLSSLDTLLEPMEHIPEEPHHVSDWLSEMATKQLLEVGHYEKVNLEAIFCGAANLVLAEMLKEKETQKETYPILSSHTVDLRRFWRGDGSQILGCWATPVKLACLSPAADLRSFWIYVNTIHKEIKKAKTEDSVLKDIAFRQVHRLAAMEFKRQFWCQSDRQYDYCVLDLGDITKPLFENTDIVKPEAVEVNYSMHKTNFACSHILYVFDNRFYVTIDYSTKYMSDDFARTYLHKVLERIKKNLD